MRIFLGQQRAALLVLLSVGLACGASQAAEPSGDKSKQAETPLLEFAETPLFRAGQYHITLDAGTLNVDSKYRVSVVIENPTTEKMVFRGVKTSCACFDAKASSLVLEPRDQITLEFTAPVPAKMKRPDAYWRVRLEPKAKSDLGGIAVKINYNVAGLMGFFDKRVVLETTSRKPVNEFRLPMILTKPVEAKNVLVHLPDSFNEVEAKVVTENDKHFLYLEVTGELLEAKYVAGEIGCMDSATGIEDNVYCVLRKKGGASVYPGILRARKLGEDDERSVISAVIRVEAAPEIDDSDKKDDRSSEYGERPPNAIVDAMLDNKPLKIEVTPMSSSVYRAKVFLSEKAVERMKQMKNSEIHWLIRTKEETYKLRSAVSLPR